MRWAQEPHVSNGGDRVAWCEVSLDLDRDEPVSNIMVAASRGDNEPRRFSEGPARLEPSLVAQWRVPGLRVRRPGASGGAPCSSRWWRCPRRSGPRGRCAGSVGHQPGTVSLSW